MLKDAIDLSAVRRALVIKLRHHGDVLLTSPMRRMPRSTRWCTPKPRKC